MVTNRRQLRWTVGLQHKVQRPLKQTHGYLVITLNGMCKFSRRSFYILYSDIFLNSHIIYFVRRWNLKVNRRRQASMVINDTFPTMVWSIMPVIWLAAGLMIISFCAAYEQSVLLYFVIITYHLVCYQRRWCWWFWHVPWFHSDQRQIKTR